MKAKGGGEQVNEDFLKDKAAAEYDLKHQLTGKPYKNRITTSKYMKRVHFCLIEFTLGFLISLSVIYMV